MQIGPGGDNFSLLWFLLMYIPFFLFFFYGQRLQMQMALLEIGGALKQLERMKNFAKRETLITLEKAGCERAKAEESLNAMVNYFTILPESMDPTGIVGKTEHILDVRDDKLLHEVKNILPDVDDAQARNVENLVEATAALEYIWKVIRHFYLLGKKTGNIYLVVQLQMILSLVLLEAKAYLSAIHAFKNGIPIGDGIGPLVVTKMVNGLPVEEVSKDTVVATLDVEGRKVFAVKASGPGGNVGKPGEAVKKIVEGNRKKIKLIVMIDAALKLEGEELGSVAEGVGAAIGGIGVDKFKIEEEASKYKIPLQAVVIKQSLIDAISVMKKEIYDSVSEVIKRVKRIIVENSKEGDGVIVIGVGNTIGIAQ